MKKYLITGIGGFVGRYFWEYLLEHETDFQVLGIDIMPEAPWKHAAFQYRQLNLMDKDMVHEVIADYQPDFIVHLASISSVGQSWKNPALCFTNNTTIFLNIIEAVRKICPNTRILSVGSSEEYGNYPAEAMPLREDYELRPSNPYAVARVAQEMLSKLYAQNYGLNIMMTRSFNHIGPHQKNIFAIPSFINQLVEIKKNGNSDSIMYVGNICIYRDFLDVRDVVDAYYRIITTGVSGEIYNVCSGKSICLSDIISYASLLLNVRPVIKVNNKLLRKVDNKIIVGDNNKLKYKLGWSQKYSIYNTIKDMIDNIL